MNMPFSTEQFFEVFRDYNVYVFPIQLILLATGAALISQLHRNWKYSDRLITGFLAFLWIWVGSVYHLIFFSAINRAAYVFGVLFILQGIFFAIEIFKKRLEYSLDGKTIEYLGYGFIIFGLVIYPIISYALEGEMNRTITLGLPCPTTIFTFGLLMLTSQRLPRYLLIIPTIWAIIGTGAAVNFGVYQDFVMLLAALVADFILIGRTRVQS
jgi:hypothetical protein